MTGYKRQSILMLFVVVCIQGAVLLGIVSRGNRDFISNIVGSALFWAGYTILEQIKGMEIHFFVRAVAVAAIVSDSFFGYYLNFYVSSPLYDRMQHMGGTYGMVLFCYAVVTHIFHYPVTSKWIRCLFVVALGVGVGAAYEVFEFAGDRLLQPQIPNQPGLLDTNLDLVSNLAGALIAGIHAFYIDFGFKKQ
jgi:hypothetical protein